MPKGKTPVPLMYQTQIKEIQRYFDCVDEAVQSENIQKIIALKSNIQKCRDKLEDCYYEYSVLDDFNEDEEYKKLTDSKDLADLALEKIESILTLLNQKLKLDESSKSNTAGASYVNVNLPKFDIPTFSGQFDSWLSFKSIFLSSIDSNESLSDIQKLQYLQSCVNCDASRLIKGFAITNENYKHAWETLLNRYDNQRELAFSQCKKLFNLKGVKSTAESIRVMIDTCNEVLRNFETLGFECNQLVEVLLVFSLQDKLDDLIKVKWDLTLEGSEFPSLKNFLSFLEKHARSLQGVKQHHSQEKSSRLPNKTLTLKASVKSTENDSCKLCFLSHPLHRCEKFLKMNVEDRWDFVKKSKLCFKCLRANHSYPACKFTTSCRVCKQKHHTILHTFRQVNQNAQYQSENQNQSNSQEIARPTTDTENQPICLTGHMNDSKFILLSTAIVRVKNDQGQYVNCRALIDGGSQASLITKSCCKDLNLHFHKAKNDILGLSDKIAAQATKGVDLNFSPHFSQEPFSVTALVVENLTCNLPNFFISDFNWPHLQGLTLADPSFHISRPVDIILGADIFFDLIQNGKISGMQNQPSALNSKLGWLLSGRIASTTRNKNKSLSIPLINCHALLDLENVIQKFWEIESVPNTVKLSAEDQEVEKFYLQTTRRNCDGRYIVNLPFKKEVLLGNSRNQARQRFFSLEKRFQDAPELKDQYVQFMKEYEELGHMQLVPSHKLSKPVSECFYLPHFGIIREQSKTTKLRVVFDASAKSNSGSSLNDALYVGPKLQNELFSVLVKFRCYPIALTGDIEKMFRQIQINRNDVDFQRILWRENPEDPLLEYELLTVTYGTAPAPYLAIRTIQQLAKDEAAHFPKASKVALNDFYVDDLLTGANTEEEAQQLVNQMIKLMKRGGFSIRKWASNKTTILQSLPSELRSFSGSLLIDEDHVLKILGIFWDSVEDTFRIKINPMTEDKLTKRQLLSTIAKIYDPLGFLSPTTVQLKILMQELWKENISWDDPLPNNISKTWMQFKNQMEQLSEIKIPRYLSEDVSAKQIKLIGFCDSSQRAYAAVFYLRTEQVSGKVHVSMIASKTKVAPVKPVTMPRLELMAALLLSQLYVALIESLKKIIQIDQSYLYSDSQIVLDWLKSSPSRWKTFVANRITKIQELTSAATWRHVRGEDNPADCASRGISASSLKTHALWWSGPPFLEKDYSEVSSTLPPHSEQEIDCEKNSSLVLTGITVQNSYILKIIDGYSSFIKLIRVISWCMRFINNCKTTTKLSGWLSCKEMDAATKTVTQIVQTSEFRQELHHLKMQAPLPKNSKFHPLNIFLDSDGILKVGGRLKNSNLNQNQKHPTLLPKDHHFTKIIVEHYHLIHLHSGPQLTLSCIRQKFWIPCGRDVVRRILAKCLTCFRLKSQPCNQVMGNLPASRFIAGRAFLNVGLDFGGPFTTKPNVPRSRIKLKSYIALFICFATKAVHLEVVSDLSTDAFLAALRRFISRRGRPDNLYSDNATNFKGASSYLNEQRKIIYSSKIRNFLTQEAINWHFIPPSAPHFGGLWEAGIKSTKHHLIKICKSAILNFEELVTLVTQIEACLNSRPLTPLSSDPQDLEPLTAGHFLIGAPLTALPKKAPTESIPLKKRWHLIQQLRNQFWCRWQKEYLSSLQQRVKWTKTYKNLQINDLVLLKDENLPPMKWSLGRVSKVFPGGDGVVRVVEVKTSKGLFQQPVIKCCLLPSNH